MSALLRLEIFTAEKRILGVNGVRWLRAELVDGGIGIHPGHAPLVAETADGLLVYADEQGEHRIELRAGILDIRGGVVTIFTSVDFQNEFISDKAPKTFNRLMGGIVAGLVGGEADAEKRDE